MKYMTRLGLLSLLVLFVSLTLVACAGSSESDDDDDGGGCTSNFECYQAGSNWSCNTSEQTCMDHGLCTQDADCQLWYGPGSVCGTDGLCVGGSDDDDDNNTDDDDDNNTDDDDDNTDGDTGCPNLSGVYDGTYACESTSNHTTWVYVDEDCEITVDSDFGTLTGSVDGSGDISITGGGECTGTSSDSTITLDCGSCTITLTPQSDNPGGGVISVTPAVVNFGAVGYGDSTFQTANISNMGEGELEISRIVLGSGTTEDFSLDLGDWSFTQTMSSGSNKDLKIDIDVVSNGPRNGTLVIFSNDANNPVLAVPITSQMKAEPRIELDPPLLNLGSLPAGETEAGHFLIKSVGGATATITAVTITNDGNGSFSLVDGGPSTPFSLDTPYTSAVEVSFSPVEGVHEVGVVQSGQVCVTYYNALEQEVDVCLDLVGSVHDRQPACIDVRPQDGRTGIWGIGFQVIPGPGIRWGFAQVGAPNTRDASFRNCGDETLEITSMMWNNMLDSIECAFNGGRPFAEAPGSLHPYSLERNETVFIEFTFIPRSEGQSCAAGVQIQSNATTVGWSPLPAAPDTIQSFHMGLAGAGANRNIDVLPPKIDFGLITLECCSRPEAVTVWNVGDLVLTVETVSIGVGSSDNCGQANDNCAFSLVDLPGLPYLLGGENENGTANPQSFSFRVKFCPVRMGMHEGLVEIASDDANSSTFIVPLKGEGTNISHQVDEFQQITHPMVDILWVVDCSGSMGEEQSNLSSNFQDFINEAVTWNADLQIAVVSMDMDDSSHAGQFQCFLKNRGSGALSNNELISRFQDCVELGTSCSGEEKGLDAAHDALSAPLLTGDTTNPGPHDEFLREDAKLSIIFVSDEDDQSVGDIGFFSDFFRQIKGYRNTNMLEGYSIVGDRGNGCTGNGGDASAGTRYIDVADNINPHASQHFMSICETDFSTVYQSLADNLFALRSQFFLSRLADPNTVHVEVNGVETTDYEYDEESNSVIFDENDPPAPGATIRVEYDTLCLH